jgi:hypothetical protein
MQVETDEPSMFCVNPSPGRPLSRTGTFAP